MNNQVSNPKIDMNKTVEMNDEDYINSALECAKNISTNFNIALNEMSNETLYQQVFPMFESIRQLQRNLYELSFQKGFYTLEKAEPNKITQKQNQLEQKIQELS